jgi:hypothetical protein
MAGEEGQRRRLLLGEERVGVAARGEVHHGSGRERPRERLHARIERNPGAAPGQDAAPLRKLARPLAEIRNPRPVMQRSFDRIYTTHVGSLARPRALLDLMKAAAEGRAVDPAELAEAERRAVTDVVARQRSAGLDVVSDGEQSKTGFYAYVRQRLSGFEPRPGRDPLATVPGGDR